MTNRFPLAGFAPVNIGATSAPSGQQAAPLAGFGKTDLGGNLTQSKNVLANMNLGKEPTARRHGGYVRKTGRTLSLARR